MTTQKSHKRFRSALTYAVGAYYLLVVCFIHAFHSGHPFAAAPGAVPACCEPRGEQTPHGSHSDYPSLWQTDAHADDQALGPCATCLYVKTNHASHPGGSSAVAGLADVGLSSPRPDRLTDQAPVLSALRIRAPPISLL